MNKKLMWLLLAANMMLVSCGMKNEANAVDYFNTFLKEKKSKLVSIKYDVDKIAMNDEIIYLSTKPGSHLLNTHCAECIGGSEMNKRKIADFIDENNIRYIKSKKGCFIAFALTIRNYDGQYYLATLLNNPSEAEKFENIIFKDGSWILISGKFVFNEVVECIGD